MRKHNQIHTLGAPHYKAYFRFLRKLKDFKWSLWSEKYGNRKIDLLLEVYPRDCAPVKWQVVLFLSAYCSSIKLLQQHKSSKRIELESQ